MVILITGKAGAGKTHYASELKKELIQEGLGVICIDGDDLRVKDRNEDFSDQGRILNLTHAAELAKRYEMQGNIVVCSFIAPKREWRDMMRSYWKESILVYMPGGHLWEGTEYERPSYDELKILTS